jgi:hypothetical protein
LQSFRGILIDKESSSRQPKCTFAFTKLCDYKHKTSKNQQVVKFRVAGPCLELVLSVGQVFDTEQRHRGFGGGVFFEFPAVLVLLFRWGQFSRLKVAS